MERGMGAGSEVWTSKLGAELGHTRVDDGTFWMSWHDFLCRFTVVDVCKAHEGWHAISVQAVSAENDPAFEVEVAPDRGASSSSSWAYAMSLQPNKRGLCSERFWYADVGIAVYRKGESKTLWADVDAGDWSAGSEERVAQVELMFEVGVTYLVRFFSVTGHKAGPPPILRLYSARPLRVRPMRTPNLVPNLAPALTRCCYRRRRRCRTFRKAPAEVDRATPTSSVDCCPCAAARSSCAGVEAGRSCWESARGREDRPAAGVAEDTIRSRRRG